jgi:hypothetical protein
VRVVAALAIWVACASLLAASVAAAPARLRFEPAGRLPGSSGLQQVSCAAPSSCVALAPDGRAFVRKGSRWAPVARLGRPVGTQSGALTCSASAGCLALAGSQGTVFSLHGTSWTGTNLGGAVDLRAVGCSPSGFCAAIDALGNSFAASGGAWVRTSGDWGTVKSISCVSSTFCMSAGPNGLSRSSGSSWTMPETLGLSHPLVSVSCPTESFCVAIDAGGHAVRWNGSRWLRPVRLGNARDSASPRFGAVTCATPTRCLVVTGGRRLFVWTGSRWVAAAVPGQHAIVAASCSSPRSCILGDRDGRLLQARF